jgi:glycosyltransferase involved in cell wall biosynthesis
MQCYRKRYDPSLELRLTGRAESLSADAGMALRRLSEGAPVRFLGDVSDAELARQYAAARVLLMLSYEEGFGLPVLEAMACGCPVVAADRAALPEVVGDAGLLVDPNRPDQAAEAMRTLITDSARREEFVRRGKRRTRKFGWDVAASRIREVYEGVLRTTARCAARSGSHKLVRSQERSVSGAAASCIR